MAEAMIGTIDPMLPVSQEVNCNRDISQEKRTGFVTCT